MVLLCDVLKVNWDVTIDKPKKMMSVWVIVRDKEGNVLASMCFLKQFIVNPTVVKAYAAWKAVEFSRDLGMLNIILEGDGKFLTNGMTILKSIRLIDQGCKDVTSLF
jgi:hypothetical protein